MKLGIRLVAPLIALQAGAPIVKYRDNIKEHEINGKPLKSDPVIGDGKHWRKVTDADCLGAFNSTTIVQRFCAPCSGTSAAPPAPAQLASVERGVCAPERALIGSCL